MAKKKRRKKKYRKAISMVGNCGTNRHHILWQRAKWAKQPWASKLRSHPAVVAKMDAGEHRLIHERMMGIPVASETACKAAYVALDEIWKLGEIDDQTCLETRLRALICFFNYSEKPTADALKRQLRIVKEIRAG